VGKLAGEGGDYRTCVQRIGSGYGNHARRPGHGLRTVLRTLRTSPYWGMDVRKNVGSWKSRTSADMSVMSAMSASNFSARHSYHLP
jgi:hypothetical protein